MTGSAFIEVEGLCKDFLVAQRRVPVLLEIDLAVERGEFLAITGPSGSGKTTLLHILGGLERPSAGSYRLAGSEFPPPDDDDLSLARCTQIGFVFQSFHLIAQLDILENVAMPFLYAPRFEGGAYERSAWALARVGLSHRLDHRPAALSGGEMQRAAIARAIVMGPSLILADEPTGNLDSATGAEILALLEELNRDGTTLVMVTHDESIAARASRRACVRDGRLEPA